MSELQELLDKEKSLKEMQLAVDEYVQQFKAGYFPPMSQMVRLTEEIGELAREIQHVYGNKQKKAEELPKEISEELADVFVVLLMMANSLGIDLTDAFEKDMNKFYQRDSHRFERKDEGKTVKNIDLIDLPESFQKAAKVIEQIETAGYEAYFVGGCVRDILLGRPIHDIDIATSAFPMEMKEIFPKTIDVGIEHGTVLTLVDDEQYEITTFRTESTYQDYRRPDSVTFVRSLEEDLKRRDFTMNALAMTKDGKIIDLFDGYQDIQQKIIRAVGDPSERFHEDALRMMRAMRFSSQLDFTIEEKTFRAIAEYHQLLEKISIERIHEEWIKLLLGKNCQQGLQAFIDTDCYLACPGFSKDSKASLERFSSINFSIDSEELAWLVLILFLQLREKEVADFLKSWKCSNHIQRSVHHSFTLFHEYLRYEGWTKEMLYRSNGEWTIELVEAALPFFGKESHLMKSLAAYRALPIHRTADLAVDGSQLMTALSESGGAWLGQLLKELELEVLLGKLENNSHTLIEFAKQWKEENR